MEKKTCLNCQEGCQVCFNDYECVECTDEYFMIDGEAKVCNPQNELTNCQNKTKTGCERCSDGYYLDNRRCHQCKGYCTLCETSKCRTCQDGYILEDNDCHDVSFVE